MKTTLSETIRRLLWGGMCLLALFATGCSEEKTPGEPGKEPDRPGQTYEEHIVLKESTLQLSQEQAAWVDSVAGDSILVFRASTPQNLLPQVGTTIARLERSANIPDGFLGRVTQVEPKNGGYWVVTEQVPLDEAFEELEFEGTIDLVPVGETTRGLTTDEEGFLMFSRETNLGYEGGDAQPGLSGGITNTNRIGIRLQASGNLLKGNARFIVAFKVASDTEIELNSASSLSPAGDGLAIPLTGPGVLVPNVVLTPLAEIKGELTLKGGYSYCKVFMADCQQEGGQWTNGNSPQPAAREYDKLSVEEASINGSVAVGIGLGFELRVLNCKYFKIGSTLSGCLAGEGSIDVSGGPGNAYELLKDAKLEKSLRVGNECAVTFGPFHTKILSVEDKLWGKDYHVLPAFESVSAQVAENGNAAVVSAQVKRDLLFDGTRIGMGLWDDLGEPLQTGKATAYHREEEFPSPWETAFTKLRPGNYHVYPYVLLPVFPDRPIVVPEGTDFSIAEDDRLAGVWEQTGTGTATRLELAQSGKATLYAGASTEPPCGWQAGEEGRWTKDTDTLRLAFPGGDRRYDILRLADDELALRQAGSDGEPTTYHKVPYTGAWELTRYYYREFDSEGHTLVEETETDFKAEDEWSPLVFRADDTFLIYKGDGTLSEQGAYYVKGNRLYWGDNEGVLLLSYPGRNRMEMEFWDDTAIEPNRYYMERYYLERQE